MLAHRRFAQQINILQANGDLGPGTTFYVNSSASGASDANGDANAGNTPANPMATIAGAYALCTAGRGDNIVCGPGHAESVSSAAWLTIAKTGITLLGQGRGLLRPTLTWTATAGQILHTVTTGANTKWKNFIFDHAAIAVVVGMTCAADSVTFEDCRFNMNATGLIGITLAATANNFTMRRCKVRAGTAVGAATATYFLGVVGTTGLLIEDCDMSGCFTSSLGPISNSGTLASDIMIRRSLFANLTTASTVCIDFAALVATGFVHDNRFFVTTNSDIQALGAASAAIWCSENYVTNVVLETGLVMGTVSG